MDEKKGFSKIKIVIIICLALVILMPFVVRQAKKTNNKEDFDESVEYINSKLKYDIEKEYKDRDDINDILVDLQSEIYKKKNYSFITWDLNAYVDVYVDDSFDALTPDEILEKLQKLYREFIEILDNEVNNEVPLYNNCSGNQDYKYTDKYNYTSTVYCDRKIDFHVKTSSNDYMYGDVWNDGYNLNGEDVLVNFKYYPIDTDENASNTSIGGNTYDKTNNSYDEGYDDIYFNEDYDVDRYENDTDYADGVDDAMNDAEEYFGDDW